MSLLKQANRSFFFFEQGVSGNLLGFKVGLPYAMSVSSNPFRGPSQPQSEGQVEYLFCFSNDSEAVAEGENHLLKAVISSKLVIKRS